MTPSSDHNGMKNGQQ